ncbi:hypothetical protein BC792_11964 [Sphingobacterium allocomposti]|jgi:hypothetical protein|uniref:Uncharacterized protein n=1 Tax=Sphingobacterium allocomposti TaxID=415956 RepID=A0A5S5D6A3_9SPHI|nr:hypothetical protein [Sphingobacterium composti Yoo et al. 2007 non Ten et al. 2007]TYP91540.1 hypothetical protein BC792_11964 [Sphingobacterium composti Yoo et al. 2007 non Ten et al. 2007]HLS94174.1 hypothetical protein [Sphingobacterium sp.]
MSSLKISETEWEVLKIKLQRKYNHLTPEDLAYAAGQEEDLLQRLAKRLRRDRDYVVFTLSKELNDLTSNRL